MSLPYRSSRPDSWSYPRPYQDASLRKLKHGPIRPMEEEGWAIAFGTALAAFGLRPLRVLRRAGACRYRGGLR